MEFSDKMGERILSSRLAAKLTQEQVAKSLGVSKAAIHRYEKGITAKLKRDKIQKLAEILKVSPVWLMGFDEDTPLYKNIEKYPHVKTVPVIGNIACGEAILSEKNIEAFAEVDGRVNADFALRCKGDSMINARIFNDDLVFIKSQPDVENGEIAGCIIDGAATLKRVYKYYDNSGNIIRIELRPENPLYEVKQFEGALLQEVRIIGKAVAFLSGVR